MLSGPAAGCKCPSVGESDVGGSRRLSFPAKLRDSGVMRSYLTFVRQNAHWLSAGALLTFLSSFGQTFFIAIFAGGIRAEFGLSNGQWGMLYTVATTASAAVMIWAGTLTDSFRVRVLGIFVLLAFAATALAMSLVQSVAVLGLLIFLLRFLGQGMTSHIAIVAMARWFVATRGRALSFAGLGIAAGEMLLPLSFVAMMGAGVSWRFLWVAAAVVVLLALPLLLRLLRTERTPQSMIDENPSHGMEGRHWHRMEMLRHWLFWLCTPALLGPSTFGTAMFFHQVHLAEFKGWSHLGLVSLFPLFTVAVIAGMLGSGTALDKFGTGRLMPLFLVPYGLAFVAMWQAETLIGAAVALMLMGLGMGMSSTVVSAFWAEFYGTRHVGAIKSAAVAVMVLGSALGPGITGVLIDAGVPFVQQMTGIAAYFAFAAALVFYGVSRARPLLARAPEIDVIRP